MSAPVVAHLPPVRAQSPLAEALRAEIVDAVRQALADTDHTAPESPARGRRMVDRAGAADYLAVSVSQVDVWARRGLITRRRWGRVVRYDLDDLDRFADTWEQS